MYLTESFFFNCVKIMDFVFCECKRGGDIKIYLIEFLFICNTGLYIALFKMCKERLCILKIDLFYLIVFMFEYLLFSVAVVITQRYSRALKYMKSIFFNL